MDWNAVVERNETALRRILGALLAMTGIAFGPHPGARTEGEPGRTLPRHLYRVVLGLLRPTESATRRLIIVAARGLVVALPPARPKPSTARPAFVTARLLPGHLPNLGLANVASPPAPPRRALRSLSLPLADPLYRLGPRRRTVPNRDMPRIGWGERLPVAPPPLPDDAVDASRIVLRLRALGRALDDLPGQALRFARWRAAHAAAVARDERQPAVGLFRRISPLRFGYPYGIRRPGSRRRAHEIDEVLRNLHYFAIEALKRPDTS